MASETNQKIEAYFAQYRKREYPKDQIIIHADDEPEFVYYIESGKVRQYGISYRGDEVVVNVMRQGAFFPVQGLLTGLPNTFFYAAQTDSVIRLASPEKTKVFLEQNPDVVLDLLTRVYVGTEGLLGRMVQLMSGNAHSRLMYELVIECRRFGEWDEDGDCFIRVNESELAARAGLSRETVSREIQKLTKKEIVQISHSGIMIRDLKALERQLGIDT